MKIFEIREPGEKKKKARALLLFSGGLDSVLAGKVLEEQGVEIVCLTFRSSFFGAREAIKAAAEQGWPLIVADITREQIRIVENPRYGYGRQLNPCIDCHGQMARLAAELLQRYQADFVATGEVLGERPKSQNLQALGLVEKLSGIKGLVLRPLSAKLLAPTLPEEKGLVERDKLLDIRGRSRKRQLELADRYQLKEYLTPAGGCLLTDPGFAARARQLRRWRGALWPEDIELVRAGRAFLEAGAMIVVGRDERENDHLLQTARETDVLITTAGIKGPLAVVRLKAEQGSDDGQKAGIELRLETIFREAVSEAAEAGNQTEPEPVESGAGAEPEKVRCRELRALVTRIQEGRLNPEAAGTGAEEVWVLENPAIREACLLVIRYSRARHLGRAAAAIIRPGKIFRLEFEKADWEKYLPSKP
ncbi:MAG: hypothetical protein QME69_09175 [Candidatus Saccharicenans sp.]|nr:hypothetical protein [Candidatus Saccharicenans sp.]